VRYGFYLPTRGETARPDALEALVAASPRRSDAIPRRWPSPTRRRSTTPGRASTAAASVVRSRGARRPSSTTSAPSRPSGSASWSSTFAARPSPRASTAWSAPPPCFAP